jgi:hypothetical protein
LLPEHDTLVPLTKQARLERAAAETTDVGFGCQLCSTCSMVGTRLSLPIGIEQFLICSIGRVFTPTHLDPFWMEKTISQRI